MNAGIDLEAMNEDYWEELADVTNVESQKYHQYEEKIDERDLNTSSHLQKLQQEINEDKSTDDEDGLPAGFESLNLTDD